MSASKLVASLRGLQQALMSQGFSAVAVGQWGWPAAALDREDLVALTETIVQQIEALDWTKATSEVGSRLDALAARVNQAATITAPNLSSGPQGFEAISTLLTHIALRISALATPDQLKSGVVLPAAIRRSVDATMARLDQTVNRLTDIEDKAAAIERAYSAAESLDVTTHELDRANATVRKIAEEVAAQRQRAQDGMDQIKVYLEELSRNRQTAEEALQRIEHTFRSSTSRGLAYAFSDRAGKLGESVLIWMLALIASLFIAGVIGSDRFQAIQSGLGVKPDWGVVTVNVVLAALGLSPAVWMAWVATKQIGQRFRLSEDYAYKASLSNAYEGYRAEAVQLDERFQAQLFGTALSRLDELPIRLVERDVHGSPLQDMLQSSGIKLPSTAPVPSLLDRILDIVGLQRKKSVSSAPTEKVEIEPKDV